MKSPISHANLALLILSLPLSLNAADTASIADKTFVAKVSQGGMYEVEASKVATEKAVAQDVKDLANTEVHDHSLVNHELIQIANASGVDVAPQLNSQFRQRLDVLKRTSGAQFDIAYANDMAQIHDMDEKLFAKEAVEGSGNFKAFAAKTDLIVKRHIGAIHGADPQ